MYFTLKKKVTLLLFIIGVLSLNISSFIYVHAANGPSIIVDNKAAAQKTGGVSWNVSAVLGGKYGKDYAYASVYRGTDSGDYIEYRPNIETAGYYKVYYWVPNGTATRPKYAKYTIAYNDGSNDFYVDQQTSGIGGKWVPLGTYNFFAGTSGYVRIWNKLENSQDINNLSIAYVNADAIKFEYVDRLENPQICEDFEDGDSGEWSTVGADWSVVTDGSKGTGQKVFTHTKSGETRACFKNSNIATMEGEATVRITDANTSAYAGILLMYQDYNNFYQLRLNRDGNNIQLVKKKNGVQSTVGTYDITINTGVYYSLKMTLTPKLSSGNYEINCYLNAGNIPIITFNDSNVLTTGAFGFRSNNCAVNYDDVKYTVEYDDKAVLSGPVRGYSDQAVMYLPKGSISNQLYKLDFYEAVWNTGQTIVHDTSIWINDRWMRLNTDEQRLDEQWVVFSGVNGKADNYYSSLKNNWVAFNGFELSGQTVTLTDSNYENSGISGSNYFLSITWQLPEGSADPEITVGLTPKENANYLIGYQSLIAEPSDLSTIDEVICGIRLHAKMAGTVESMGLYQLTAPMSIYQKTINSQQYTFGIYPHKDSFPVEFETGSTTQRNSRQRFGMSLRNNENKLQPVLYCPQYGEYTNMTANTSYIFKVCFYARQNAAYQAYKNILENQYGYTNYRKNVYGNSLTDAIFNMIDLMMIEPEEDDSVNYVKSKSGWWSRAKYFIDIENDKAVRATGLGSMLGAYYLTGDSSIYSKRALPILEFGLSRNGYGWTPDKTAAVYGNTSNWKMSAVPFEDAANISALYNYTKKRNAGIYKLASEVYPIRNEDRSGFINPLMMYRMTGIPSYYDLAEKNAMNYIQSNIDLPYTKDVEWGSPFVYQYAKSWTELLEMYEDAFAKGSDNVGKILAGAYKEAQRYSTELVARPIPVSTQQPVASNVLYAIADKWDSIGGATSGIYPRQYLPEDVEQGGNAEYPESWITSPIGMTYEQGSTAMSYRLNLAEAPSLYRVGMYNGDNLLENIAQNMVVGRFTNYPGYYYREYMVSHLKSDYPINGPAESNSIYYHHIPAMLGYAMDYLITESVERSNQNIEFPGEFETTYLWFKYRLFGHKDGTFYGNSNVWLWMPRDAAGNKVIDISGINHEQINWITAESHDVGHEKFYISLTNEFDQSVEPVITLNSSIIGFDASKTYNITIITDNGTPVQDKMTNGTIHTVVSAKGITAIIISMASANIPVDLHTENTTPDAQDKSYFFDRHGPVEGLKAMLLERPDRSGYDAYIQTNTESICTLYYSTDGGVTYTAVTDNIYPMEWSVYVNDVTKTFKYYILSENRQTTVKTLYLPNEVQNIPEPDPIVKIDPYNIVVDNDDIDTGNVDDFSGTWVGKTALNGYYNDRYLTATTFDKDEIKKIRWRPDIPLAGTYKVYIWLPDISRDSSVTAYSTNAKYTVCYNGGSQSFTINQRNGDGQNWVQLGTTSFDFLQGTGGYVELTTNGANATKIAADAVKFVLDAGEVPQVLIDAPAYDVTQENVTVKINVHNNTGRLYKAVMISALYHLSGESEEVRNILVSKQDSVAANSSAVFSVSINIRDVISDFKIKTFLWDSLDTMKPLTGVNIFR